ncbi:hypothetical protein Tco_0875905, partial [Tanacetum coccineum]
PLSYKRLYRSNTRTYKSVVSNPKINKDRVIIENWNSDDEEEEYEVQTTQIVKTRDDKSGQNSKKQGIGFRKVKACFVCKSTDHLIKDCNFNDKKSQEPKLKNVVNIGQREGNPVWDNTKRINHQNFSKYPHLSKTFISSGVLTRIGLHRPSVSTARPISTARPSVSIARLVCTAKPSVSTARPVYPRMDNVRPRGSCSTIKRSYYTKPAFRPKDLKQDVKTFRVQNMTTARTRAVVNNGKGKMDIDLKKLRWVWRPKGNYLDHESKDSGSFMLKKGNPEILLQDHAVVDSVEDVAPAAHEIPSESSPIDNDVQDSEDVADKEGQHQMTEDEQVLHDDLEKMIAQEVVAKALDDATRQAFEEEKKNVASQKRAA